MKKMKKAIALLLSTLMLFTLFAPCTAIAQTNELYPTVYVTGFGTPICKEAGNVNSGIIYPTGADVGAIVEEAIGPCLEQLAKGIFTGDFDPYCDELYNAIAPIYDDLVLNPDGTPKDNSGPDSTVNKHIYLDYTRFSGGEIRFPYDWRLSPETVADDLSYFIDRVLAKTGKDKVNLIGRCLGGNIVSAYLQNDAAAAEKINEVIFFVPSTEGIGLIGALFSGQIDIDAKNLDTYVDQITKYQDIIEDSVVSEFLTVMLSILEQVYVLDVGTMMLQLIVDSVKENLVPRLVRQTYGSFPSFWAMIPDEYLEDAIAFVYNTPELQEEYAGTIALARSFNENIQANARENITVLSETMDISVVSKYNLPLLPLFTESTANSDGVAETALTSFGATTADYGMMLSEDDIAVMSEDALLYLSPDEKIDASTCVLPDKTWFIKNSYHDHFPESIDVLLNTILVTPDMTVFSNEAYPQYLDNGINGEDLVPVTEKDEPLYPSESMEGRVNIVKRLVVIIIAFLVRIFSQYFSK